MHFVTKRHLIDTSESFDYHSYMQRSLWRLSPVPRDLVQAFAIWLMLLLALLPSKIARGDGSIAWDQEVVRVAGASLLGALATWIAMAILRRWPERSILTLRRTALQLGTSGALALGLIAASCCLAETFQIGDTRPFAMAFPDHVARNWLLLSMFVALSSSLLLRAADDRRLIECEEAAADANAAPDAPPTSARSQFIAHVEVQQRGEVHILPLAGVLWAEAQENYVALHTDRGVHLVRGTLSAFQSKIDPEHFIRVHRRALVAIDRMRSLSALGSGDAELALNDGTRVRVSRRYRDAVRAALRAQATPPDLR